jgi:hypothetical protein
MGMALEHATEACTLRVPDIYVKTVTRQTLQGGMFLVL